MKATQMQNSTLLKRTQPLRPSKIGLFSVCPLRYIFETERPEPGGLLPGPQVYLGIAFHNAIENFWGQSLVKGTIVREWIRSEFGKKLTAEDRGLCQWLYNREGIDALISPSLVSDASRLAQQQVALSGYVPLRGGVPHAENGQAIFGVERRVFSEKLDLAGRTDLVEMDGDRVSVVDFKLGFSLDESGEPKHEYLLQLAAYALIVKEVLGDISVSLELRSPKKTFRREFDLKLESKILDMLKTMRDTLPLEKPLDQTILAREGEHCLACGYRPVCSNYQNRLAHSQAIDDDFVSPLDVCGEVISVTSDGDMASVLLRAEPDLRRVYITGIPREMIEDGVRPGDYWAAYSLGTPEVRGKGNYIANFHLLDLVNFRQSAFSCKIVKSRNVLQT